MLKLVRFKVLYVKREYEEVIAKGDELVFDNMDSTAFTAWKIAQLQTEGKLKGIPDKDKKYLRVYYEVLDRYPRERFKFEEEQIDVLKEIRDKLPGGKSENGSVKSDSGGDGGGGGGGGHAPAKVTDPYTELHHRLQLSDPFFEKLADDLKKYATQFGQDLAKAINDHRQVGFFESPAVDAGKIANALKNPNAPFKQNTFDRFTGKAQGDLRIYRYRKPEDKEPFEIKAPPTYSIWGETKEVGEEFIQKITGSNYDYVSPEATDELNTKLKEVKADLIYNIYRKDLGILSWSSFYQNHNNQMRSLGYEVGGDFIMWINQLLDPDMQPTFGPLSVGDLEGGPVDIHKDQYVVSVDRQQQIGGKTYFDVYAMHLDFDFAKGHAIFMGPILRMRNELK